MHLWKTFLDVTIHENAFESPVLRHKTNITNYYWNTAVTTDRTISEIYGTSRTDSDIFLSVTVD
jgi:CDP-diacylglycerol pyrophosphatase